MNEQKSINSYRTAEEILKECVKADWLISGDSGKAMIQAMEIYASQFKQPAEPFKQEQEREDGWRYNPVYLKSLTEKVNELQFGEGLSMEEVEAVLLALSTPPLPAADVDKKADNDMDAKEFFSNLFSLDFMTSEEQETIFKGAELFAQGKVRQLSRVVQDRNFMVRLKANIDRRMKETGIKDVIYGDAFTSFIRSLEDITLETLQGKEPNPILSRGFTEEEMGTAWQSGYESGLENEPNNAHDYLASLPASGKVEGEDWVTIQNALPEYNSSVWFYCPTFKTVLDGIFYEEDAFNRSKVFIRKDGSHFLLNEISHWKYNHLPAPPDQKQKQ